MASGFRCFARYRDMSKRRDKEITAEDLGEYLNTQDDFDLELWVYRNAKERGLVASHGGTYDDPITQKPRQYDVRAESSVDHHGIALAIECKSLTTSYPLL